MPNGRKYYWLRLKEDFFDDKVVRYLRRLPEGDSLVIIYLKMQLKSLKTDGILKYDGIMPTCEEELALAIDENPMLVTGAINALVQMGVVEKWDNDTLYMRAMQELIGSESDSASRVRKHREAKRLESSEALQSNAAPLQSNADVTECNADVTSCNTEKREKREELEIELEKRDRARVREKRKEIEQREDNIDTYASCEAMPHSEGPQPAVRVPYAEIMELYNSICVSYPKCTALSDARKKAIRARFAGGYTLEDFRTLFEKAQASSFLKGNNNRDWKATFDWLIRDTNIAKVLDGNYDDNGRKGNYGGAKSSGNEFLDMLREEQAKEQVQRDDYPI